jgi:hypothetical protein
MKKILEPSINRISSQKMTINSKKTRKFPEGFGQHLNAFLEPFALKKDQDALA